VGPVGAGMMVRALTWEADGTRYRLVVWAVEGRGIGVAWPDVRWSVGDLSAHAAPSGEWLASQGLGEVDARNVAAALETVWSDLTGAG
jgi:hypothetical protein